MNWLSSLPLQLVLVFGTVGISFIGGCQFGQHRIEAKWGAERSAQAIDAARQSQRVVDTNLRQDQINQEISNEFRKQQAALASIRPVVCDGRIGLRINPDGEDSPVPEVPGATASAAPTRSDTLPAPQGDAGAVSCEQLSKDAAQTTLMLVEIQRWLQKQDAVEP
ncbi:MAG: hypothetical protein ACOYB2_07520 [Limnohabitans sp.]